MDHLTDDDRESVRRFDAAVAARDEARAEVAALTAQRDRLASTLAETRQKLLDILNAFEAERATLTAERDNARHGRNETDQWADVLRQQLHDADTERDRLRQERDSLAKSCDDAASHLADEEALRREVAAERDTLAAQLARAEPVIEAAVQLPTDHLLSLAVDAVDTTSPKRSVFWQSIVDQVKAFEAALDAYQATPATTEREGAGDA
jgi:chromosome segregation ATPase